MNEPEISVYSDEQLGKITQEFDRLKGMCYLDHAGSTLYSERQIKNIFQDLSCSIYSNPHAQSTSSQSTQDSLDIIRYQILSFFHTNPDEYSVIFTSGATQALKIISETFNFDGGTLVYLEDNHTSVLGMRHFADFKEIKTEEAYRIFEKYHEEYKEDESICCGNGLFVYPAQSNFSGTKYPLQWLNEIKKGCLNEFVDKKHQWYTVLDAACYVSTNNLDLSKYRPDFVPVSFYKIFGYPTGLGALLVKKNVENLLEKTYFGGGTVLMALSSENVMIPRPNIYERFEDGTLNFLSILSLKHGFDTLKRLDLNPDIISKHTFALAQHVYNSIISMKHYNGSPVAVLYHDSEFQDRNVQGGIVNFNLKKPDGKYVGYAEVLHMANLHNIQLRTGCFCNPGACQRFLNLSSADVRRHFQAGHICGDQHDLVDGYPTGSVRISFGYMSTFEDADKFLDMIEKCFVTKNSIMKDLSLKLSEENATKTTKILSGTLVNIFLYPIKSCGAYSPKTSWQITSTGLKYDRNWMIVNSNGSCVSQKQVKSMCLIRPILDLENMKLRLKFEGAEEISIPLEIEENSTVNSTTFCNSKVCGDKIQGYDCGDDVAEWLSVNLKKSGLRLLKQSDRNKIISGKRSEIEDEPPLSLANKAQYLMINSASIRWLKDKMHLGSDHISFRSLANRFRANFLVDFDKPFVENALDRVFFGDVPFKFSGKCTRCQMICIDQDSGNISKEPLQVLSDEFNGNMRFGIYLNNQNPKESRIISIKSRVTGQIS